MVCAGSRDPEAVGPPRGAPGSGLHLGGQPAHGATAAGVLPQDELRPQRRREDPSLPHRRVPRSAALKLNLANPSAYDR